MTVFDEESEKELLWLRQDVDRLRRAISAMCTCDTRPAGETECKTCKILSATARVHEWKAGKYIAAGRESEA